MTPLQARDFREKFIPDALSGSVSRATQLILSHQVNEGTWWYTLEANESINAELIMLMHYLDDVDEEIKEGIVNRIISTQRDDGSWSIYFDGPGDLSTTIECYFAIKLAGMSTRDLPPLKVRGGRGELCLERARRFILSNGGLAQCRVFTRIHLALFGLVPWSACPALPTWFIHFPTWLPFSIYDFSSWARQSIVPLMVILAKKKTRQLPRDFLAELSSDLSDRSDRSDRFNIFFKLDKLLKLINAIPIQLIKKYSLTKCEMWIREHIDKTEDIYPALAYGAMAIRSLGYPVSDPTIRKCLAALKGFRMATSGQLDAIPTSLDTKREARGMKKDEIYQQCCISPVWDTPWAGLALLEATKSNQEAGSKKHENLSPASCLLPLRKAAQWLISRQITQTYGDWSKRNKKAQPGGWAFEFQNDYFPDVDDTIQVLMFLKKVSNLSDRSDQSDYTFSQAIQRGMDWLLSMQSKNGGWAAFDVDNTREWVNKIPFSDHGACLDIPSPDVTGRMLELLGFIGPVTEGPVVQRAIRFLEKTQHECGAWWGRWGVNYIYGTWCVLQGLAAMGYDLKSNRVQKAAHWIKSVQNSDGGFGESCASYRVQNFVPLNVSLPSQTAWGLMGLVAGGEGSSDSAHRAASFLIDTQKEDGGWDEEHHTGTGFPGHFYIRYHGYRYYFPLLALAKYRRLFSTSH